MHFFWQCAEVWHGLSPDIFAFSQLHEHAQEHSLCVRVEPARGAVQATVNMHLPPALPAARRQAVVGDDSAFLRRAAASVKIGAGDLKKAQSPRGGGWLSKALGPKGPLARFGAPYRPGDPTNVVWQVGRRSERELEWVAKARQGGYEGPRQRIEGCGRGTLFCGLLHVVVRRRGSRNRRFRWPGQRRAHTRDEIRVVCGVARMHGGFEAREVQREARMAALPFLRLAEELLLACLRRVREADAVGADLGEEAELGRPEAQRPSCLVCQGHPSQFGLLHA